MEETLHALCKMAVCLFVFQGVVVGSLEESVDDDHVHDAHDILILLLPWIHRNLCQVSVILP